MKYACHEHPIPVRSIARNIPISPELDDDLAQFQGFAANVHQREVSQLVDPVKYRFGGGLSRVGTLIRKPAPQATQIRGASV